LLAIDQPFLSQFIQVFIVQSVSHGDIDLVPAFVSGFVATDQHFATKAYHQWGSAHPDSMRFALNRVP